MKYQVCYDSIDNFDNLCAKVCYETDSYYDAEVYINEMYHLGDYSNYYIREVRE